MPFTCQILDKKTRPAPEGDGREQRLELKAIEDLRQADRIRVAVAHGAAPIKAVDSLNLIDLQVQKLNQYRQIGARQLRGRQQPQVALPIRCDQSCNFGVPSNLAIEHAFAPVSEPAIPRD